MSKESDIRRLRAAAEHEDRLATAAEKEGDAWDAAACREKANEYRRKARRLEVVTP